MTGNVATGEGLEMAIAVGREFGLKLQQVLGLEDQLVTGIDVSVRPDEAVKCNVSMLVTGDEADQIAALLQEYKLVPADSTQPESLFCSQCLAPLESEPGCPYCGSCSPSLTHADHAPEAAFIAGLHRASRAVESFMENMRNACTCELTTLVRTGCQCGAMEGERAGCGRQTTSSILRDAGSNVADCVTQD